jgi:hypothetical protein
MIGRHFIVIAILSTHIGCAQPKYEVIEQNKSGNASQSQKVTDCEIRFRQSDFCLLWQWENMPTSADVGSVIFKIVRSNALDDSPIPVEMDFAPELVLWMPSMNHGSSPTHVERVDTGSYRARKVFFVMPGDWELKFQVKSGSTILDEAVVIFTL